MIRFYLVIGAVALVACGADESGSSEAEQASAGSLRATPNTPGPAPIGACCLPDTSCGEVTESDCVVQNGAWAGAETSCDGRECVPPCPVVSCCRPDGTCEMEQSSVCVETGGYADGALSCDAVTCTQAPETVACCWPGSGCTADSKLACDAMGGLSFPGASCGEVECPVTPTWSCCVEGQCVTTDAAGCIAKGGAWWAGLMCSDEWSCDKPPAAGACCAQGGCGQLLEADCGPEIGTFVPGGDCGLGACKGDG